MQKPVDSLSTVTFRIKNFGFNVNGKFSGVQGKIDFNPGSLKSAFMEVSISAASIDTDNRTRDNHLRKEEYFDVEKYPRIRFVSSRVVPSNKAGTLIVIGILTVKKTSKEISIPFTAVPTRDGYRFRGDFKINRRDFMVGGNNTISDNLIVCLNIVTSKR